MAGFIIAVSSVCKQHLPDVRICPFGHFGDGNIHFNLTRPKGMHDDDFRPKTAEFNRIVHDLVAGMGGSIAAEHGIGIAKRDEFRRHIDPVSLKLMETIKAALDPQA